MVLGGKRFHHAAGSGMFAGPGNDVCPGVEHVNKGTWGMSRELPKGRSEDSGAGRTPRE